MKISYNWLREYVDVKNSAKQAAAWLTMAGLEVTSIEEKGKDSVLEIEITTNRPDWLSVIGVARELSAVTGKHIKMPKVPAILTALERDKQITVELEDKVLCPRYTARIVNGAKVSSSPQWLKDRLDSIGIRPINNVVDITNFCLFELGQPMHAFDYDKLIGKKIVVRKAKKGEEIVTIDGVKRTLDNEMLVIADEKRPVAVAGVMGGRDTEVTEATKTILLESAYFDPISIRKTQRKLVLSTDSSYRFERGVDLGMVLFASNRAAKLIAENCGGKIGILKDAGTKAVKTNSIRLSVDKVNRTLNLSLSPVAVKKILVSLGLSVAGVQSELKVDAPSFRSDLKRQEDLIEEIARVYGYDKIPTTIPRMVGHSDRKAHQRKIEELARDCLIGQGLDEIVTYSLMDKKDLANARFQDADKIVAIANPLSSQQEVMRPILAPGLLNTARFNINRKLEDIKIFELSKVYLKAGEKEYREEARLGILVSGRAGNTWRQKTEADFFYLKGALEALFESLGVKNYKYIPQAHDILSGSRSAKITAGDSGIGFIGEVRREVLNNFDIKKSVFLCEIKFEELLKSVSVDRKMAPLAKFLPTKRDISVVVDKSVCISDLLGAIRAAGGEILRAAEVSDEYFGNQIPSGKRGLTFSMEYLSEAKQLTDEEIEHAHNSIKAALVEKCAAAIR